MTTVASAGISVVRDRGVAILTADDGKANAIGLDWSRQFSEALDDAAREGDAVVLAGRPGYFSAGFDMAVMLSGSAAVLELISGGQGTLIKVLTHPRPVVAACTGHAVAAGAATLLACDARIGLAGPYKIGFHDVAVGLPLPTLVTTLAHDRLDPRAFVRATLGAAVYDPAEAVEVGFLDRVVTEDVVGVAVEEARRLASYPAEAFRLTKQWARRDLADRMRAAQQHDIRVMGELLATR